MFRFRSELIARFIISDRDLLRGTVFALFRAWNIFGTLARFLAFRRTQESTTRSNDRDVEIHSSVHRPFIHESVCAARRMNESQLPAVRRHSIQRFARRWSNASETTSCEENNGAHELTEEAFIYLRKWTNYTFIWKSIDVQRNLTTLATRNKERLGKLKGKKLLAKKSCTCVINEDT